MSKHNKRYSVLQTIAARALCTLDWLNSPSQIQCRLQHEPIQRLQILLKQELIKLLHRLLAGHLLDPELGVVTTFCVGVPALLQDWLLIRDESPLLTELCVALMQRAPGLAQSYGDKPKAASQDAMDHMVTDRVQQQKTRCWTGLWWLFCERPMLVL